MPVNGDVLAMPSQLSVVRHWRPELMLIFSLITADSCQADESIKKIAAEAIKEKIAMRRVALSLLNIYIIITDMFFKFPKDDKDFKWTRHIKDKMLFYHISEQKIKAILKSPDRREEGIAPNTSAVMKRNDKPKRQEEIWVMYSAAGASSKFKVKSSKLILVSAWRYPGKSKPGKEIPIPEDILAELNLN